MRHIAQENKRRVGRYVCMYACLYVSKDIYIDTGKGEEGMGGIKSKS